MAIENSFLLRNIGSARRLESIVQMLSLHCAHALFGTSLGQDALKKQRMANSAYVI